MRFTKRSSSGGSGGGQLLPYGRGSDGAFTIRAASGGSGFALAAVFCAGQDQAEDEAFDRIHRIGLPQVSKIPLETAHRGDGTHIGRRMSGGGRREQDRQDSDDSCFSSHTHKTVHPGEKLAIRRWLTKLNVCGRI